jgi:putative ABC transport system permease protein
MLLNIIWKSFINQKKAMALMVLSVAVGTALAASLMTLSLEIGGKVSRELREFGANILIEPKVEGLAGISGQKRYLREEDVIRTKTIFWRHNILGVAPFLEEKALIGSGNGVDEIDVVGTWYEKTLLTPGEKGVFVTGTRTVTPWWLINGNWPDSPDEIVMGMSLGERLRRAQGDTVILDGRKFTISGTLETGGREENQIFMNLDALQEFKQKDDKVSKVLISALTKPMDEFAYRDPETMTQAEYEKWYCTGYVTSIARQLEEVFQGSRARPIWQVAQTEGRILNSLKGLIYILSCIAITASALGVSTTMILSFTRRMFEIGLMKSIGADSWKIMSVFLSEALIIGLLGGIVGYLLSIVSSQFIGTHVFNTSLEQRSLLVFLSIGSSIFIAFAGSILPIRKALRIRPGIVMKGAE